MKNIINGCAIYLPTLTNTELEDLITDIDSRYKKLFEELKVLLQEQTNRNLNVIQFVS